MIKYHTKCQNGYYQFRPRVRMPNERLKGRQYKWVFYQFGPRAKINALSSALNTRGACAIGMRDRPKSIDRTYASFLLAVVVLSVAASGFFTILYSMQWGHTKSMDWLQTFLLSFVQNVIIVQPAKVIVMLYR